MIPSSFSRPVTLLQPPRIAVGAGCAVSAVTEFARGATRLALVVSKSVAAEAGQLANGLRAAGIPVAVVTGPSPEPTVAAFEALRAALRSLKPDVMVALGGGSVLDAAKLAAALHDRPEPVAQFIGAGLLPGRTSRLVCVPTTAGTGSEVSPNALLLDPVARAKKAVISPFLVPDLAVVDPELTRNLPPALTATTGIDALAHCLEAYASLAAHPAVDTFALEGVRLIAQHLPRAVACGSDLEARAAVSLGSLYGGLCLGPVNTNGVHALAYPLGGEHHVPHALSIALMLPSVVRFNASALPERHAALAAAMGASPGGNVGRDAASLADQLLGLLEACGLRLGLRHRGIGEETLPRLADAGLLVTRLLKNNPRPVSRADAISIFQAAY